jgi:drug/metabolite transporter (DMT)-like permease
MILTLNQVLGIILTVAGVVAIVFLVLFLNQLRRTAREGEKTLAKARETMDGLQMIEAKLNASLDNVGEVLAVSKKAASGISEIAAFFTSKIIRPTAKYWPFIFPLVRLGLQQMRKRKEKKDG